VSARVLSDKLEKAFEILSETIASSPKSLYLVFLVFVNLIILYQKAEKIMFRSLRRKIRFNTITSSTYLVLRSSWMRYEVYMASLSPYID
jgi:hypothetical protein